MANRRALDLLGTFVLAVVLVLGVTAAYAVVTEETARSFDGENISGQSPEQFQPENVNPDVDPEEGRIAVDDSGSTNGSILVDTRHGNDYSRADLEPVVEAAFEADHPVVFQRGGENVGLSGDTKSYNETLQGHAGVLIVQPTTAFTANETRALRAYTDAGGHVVVLAEPTQTRVGGGTFTAGISTVSFGADNLTESYGVRIGAEELYNIDDEANDNNFRSIYAEPTGDGPLTEGVGTVTFDSSGYAAVNGSDNVTVLYTAVDGTRTLDSRREGAYPVVARNGNFVFVADSSFLQRSEIYDADNEVFAGNLVEFLVSGELPDSSASPATPTVTPAPTPTATPRPTPTRTSTPASTPTPPGATS